ncbi:MAG: very short patch repair endonuclease [Chloroflexi bacterium]|nr:very short patch repair endonuclease [Ardenticatenaceae bacterium]NOG37585.1 very short patch repair endonuclease [Chloroflexota bacterium]
MSDNLKPSDRQKTMRAVKSKDTKPEKCLFAMLASMGIRGWRKHADDVVGKPDVAFDDCKLAIFVDGCFWHGCPVCQRLLKPQTNQVYWELKIQRNKERALKYNQQLQQQGWEVIRIWEHEIQDISCREKYKKRLRLLLEKKQNE